MEDQLKRRPGEKIFIWFLLAFGIFALTQAFRIPHLENLSSSGAFPIFICSILILTSIRILWKNRNRYTSFRLREELRLGQRFVFPGKVLIYTLILVLYIFSLAPLHFFASCYLFLVGSFIFLKGTSIKRSFFIGAGMLVTIYLFFQYIFKVILW
ncbi:MAG: tripartite tricarboxylate transporter TctB family protein [Deltaproteobacteria bacterium]|nr:tripartite tricarboxylate transporter TctB family protein [Deltaproteobacteria bacterium]MBM4322755.1 tripartite tricarboxylate transporter TctB family protein [Deltaproteobacteria bacterium]